MAVAYTGRGKPCLRSQVIKCGIAQPVCRTGFLEIACDCPFISLVPKIPILAGELLDVVRKPVILNKDIAPREDGRYFRHPALCKHACRQR